MPDPEQKLKRAIIKEELVALTGEWLKAVILQQFLYWGERVKDFDAFILEERLRKNEPDLELTHGWIWKSAKDLKEEIMVTPLSEDTVRRRMAELVKAGWLEERNNPYHAWDRTLQYRPSLRRIQKDLQGLGYALEHYPLLLENSPIPQGAESKPQDAESSPQGAESNPQGAGAIPETTTETTPETNIEKGAAEKMPPSHDPTFLPEEEKQLPVLFPEGAENGDYEQAIKRANWQIRSVDIRRAVVLFLEHSRLQIPFDKQARNDWIKHINIHLKSYGLDRLRELYPMIVSDMCENKLPISRPGSLTNPLAALVGEMNRNGGNRAKTNRRDDRQRDPGEKFFDPAIGQFVRRDPATGDLVPVS